MKKTFIKLTAVLIAAIFMAGCQKKADGKLKIGVIQLVEHPALDASYQGFIDGLKEAGFIDGENITIDYHNAQGEQINCVTIAEKLVNDKDDLILAIATPAAQAVANLTNKIPILVTAVTDPESAKLVHKNEMPGTNVSGTSDLTLRKSNSSKKSCRASAQSVFCIVRASKTRTFKLRLQRKNAMNSASHTWKAPFPTRMNCSRLRKTSAEKPTRFTRPLTI